MWQTRSSPPANSQGSYHGASQTSTTPTSHPDSMEIGLLDYIWQFLSIFTIVGKNHSLKNHFQTFNIRYLKLKIQINLSILSFILPLHGSCICPDLFFKKKNYLFKLKANYSTILQWFLPYIDMNQPWVYMCPSS